MKRKRPRSPTSRQSSRRLTTLWLTVLSWTHPHLASSFVLPPSSANSKRPPRTFPPSQCVWRGESSHARLWSTPRPSRHDNMTIPSAAVDENVVSALLKLQQASDISQLSLEIQHAQREFASELADNTAFTVESRSKCLRIFAKSLRRLTELRQGPSKTDAFRKHLAELVRILGRTHQGQDVQEPEIPDLVDVLVSFSLLTRQQSTLAAILHPYARVLWKGLATHKDVAKMLPPTRCFHLWRASKSLGLDHGEEFASSSSSSTLTRRLAHRLAQGDALARLSHRHLLVGLSLTSTRDATKEEEQLLVGVSRRLRKQKVRDGLHDEQVVKGIVSIHRLLRGERTKEKQQHQRQQSFESAFSSIDSIDAPTLLESKTIHEIQSTAYTLCHDFQFRAKKAKNATASEIARVMQCASRFVDSYDPLVPLLCQSLQQSMIFQPSQELKTVEIIRILEALVAWRCSSQQALLHPLGLQFLSRVHEGIEESWHANAALRCAVLLNRKDRTAMQPYCQAAVLLLRNKEFVRRTGSPLELSNFLWFFNSARYFDNEAVMNICNQLLEGHAVSDMSPREASRVLASLTDIMVWAQGCCAWSVELQTIIFELFDKLGEAFLSTRMTPSDVSRAIMSYAKAAYTNDLGIFDQLVDTMAQNTERHTSRQLVEGLWACGKMHSYDKSAPMEADNCPSFLSNVEHLATTISERVDSLNAKDTAQGLYALGVLELKDGDIVSCLAEKAKKISSEFTGQEIANMVWALGKVQSKSYDTVYSLVRRVELENSLELTPQEASNILYGLGRLDLRHEPLFSKLCNLILDQIDSASAQSLATVLWASKAVYFRPPQKLLDTWASKKLGLVAVELPDKSGV